MMTYYSVVIKRAENNWFTVELSQQKDSQVDWYHLTTATCNGLERAQEVAEQMRLARNVTEYAFKVTVHTH